VINFFFIVTLASTSFLMRSSFMYEKFNIFCHSHFAFHFVVIHIDNINSQDKQTMKYVFELKGHFFSSIGICSNVVRISRRCVIEPIE
jgi:hypothetical protein